MTDGNINGIQQVLKISSLVKEIEIDLEKLISIPDLKKTPPIIDNLQNQWKLLLDIIETLNRERPDISSTLHPDIKSINKLIDQIPNLANVSYDLTQTREKSSIIHKTLLSQQRTLQVALQQAINQPTRHPPVIREQLIRYYHKSNTLTSQLLSAFDQHDNTRLNALGRNTLLLHRGMLTDTRRLPDGIRRLSQNWLANIQPLVASEHSIFTERRREKRLTNIVDTLIYQHKSLTTSIDKKTANIVHSLREDINSQTLTLRNRLNYSSNFLLISSGICLISVIIWLYIGRTIITPMTMIKQAMINISTGKIETALPAPESNEIGDMLNALSILREYVVQVNELAQTDGLTHLLNRRQFDILTESEIRRCKREGSELSLLICDIDFFKNYNDHYGHIAGDECLKACAEIIQSHFNRATDRCFRYGGEEFVISMAGVESNNAFEMAEGLRKKIEDLAITHDFSHCAKVVTFSIGIASASANQLTTLKNLLYIADKALYKSKESGRNQTIHVIL